MTGTLFALVLGVSIAAEGEPGRLPVSQPGAGPSAFSPPNDLPSPLAPAAQQLDEDLRLVVGNNEAEVRLIGAKRLLAAGTDEAAQRLIAVLQADPPDLAAQIAICQAIADVGPKLPQLAEPLVRLLGDQRAGLGDAVAQALRRFDNGGVVDRLQSIAEDGGAPIEKRESAVKVLGEMGENPNAVGALVRLVDDGAGGIRQAALSAIEQATGTVHPDAASALAWWEAHKSLPPLEWSRSINEHRIAQMRSVRERSKLLIRRLVTSCRESYLHTLSADRPKKLLSLLGDELPEIRTLGLELINALITDRKEVGQEVKTRLVEMVADSDAGLRQKVAIMVGDLRLTEAVPKLLEVLAREQDYRARAAEVNAIGRLDGLTALPALLTCLADDAAPVIEEAAYALAALSRRIQDDAETTASIAAALHGRFKLIPLDDAELREKFLDAMARMGEGSFRSVFRAEMAPDRAVRVRRAAIIGLGAYGDADAAGEIHPLLTAAEPEIRLAAVQAMGPCGRTMADLQALAGRLDGTSETDSAVRERAWESYLQVALRMPPTEWLAISDGLARPGDQVAQRRRVELLKAVTGSPQKLKPLPVQAQIGALERMGDAQTELGDFLAAASSFEQAIALGPERSDPKVASLAMRLAVVLIRGRQDRIAAQRIAELGNVVKNNNGGSAAETLAQAALREIRARCDAANDASSYGDALKLIDVMSEHAAGLTPDFGKRLNDERTEVISRQAAVIDRLLDGIAADAQVESRLAAYGKAAVLPKVLSRLSAKPTSAPTSAAAGEAIEEKLIKLAQQFVDQWPGYAPGCPREEREKALEQLRIWSASPPAPPAPASSPTE